MPLMSNTRLGLGELASGLTEESRKRRDERNLPMEITYALSPKDAAKSLGISRATLYRMINTGRIRVVKIGSRTVIPASCLLALLDEPVEVAQ